MTELAKSYEPSEVEPKWLEAWDKSNLYQVEKPLEADFAIALPPPNVTGELHMGHALNGTLQDVLIRYHRMLGKKVHWQIGCDHAGIGTQIVVEKQLAKEGKNKYDLGRSEFEKRVWDWTEQHRGKIEGQLKLLGCSPDWSKSEFTLNPNYVRAVRKTFFEFFREGLIYQGTRLINWCPHCLTSLSDLEVVHEDRAGKLYKIKYPFVSNNFSTDGLVVATSRPETLFGDVAVAINPEDTRYQELVTLIKKGESVYVKLPLTGKSLPVILSEAVKTDFGTGALKITPAHDFNDQEIAKEWNGSAWARELQIALEATNIFDEKAHLLPLPFIPTELHHLERFKAREKTLAMLSEAELLLEEEKYTQPAALHDRCGTVIEPYLSKQWFVKMSSPANDSLDKLAIEALESGQVRFHPERYGKTYLDWLKNIQDWCISRQLWWGHQIPVWSKKLDPIALQDSKAAEEMHERLVNEFKVFSKEAGFLKKPDLRSDAHHPSFFVGSKKNNEYIFQYDTEAAQVMLLEPDEAFEKLLVAHGYVQDPDVLDTWFSSALWPFAAQGWPKETEKKTDNEPWTDVLITAREIINLWVSRMIYSSRKLTGKLPFRDILIHPVIQTPDGKRMSKSKGNAIDPIALVNKYGADASRLWYCSVGIFANQDTRFPGKKEKDGSWTSPEIESKRRFINKLWNATKFVMLNIADNSEATEFLKQNKTISQVVASLGEEAHPADLWILGRWNEVLGLAQTHLQNYRFAEFAKVLEDFVWDDFCDWYLELMKVASSPPSPLDRGSQIVAPEALRETGELKFKPKLMEVAREMRLSPTEAEQALWDKFLRSSQTGFKFTRQKAIDNFILDFYCSELLLGIEVDGEIHDKQQEQDTARTEILNSIGIQILRFTNHEILHQPTSVKSKLEKAITLRKQELNQNSPCQGGRGVLAAYILEQALRALSPIIPFATDELWNALTDRQVSAGLQSYPKTQDISLHSSAIQKASQKVGLLKEAIFTIRSIKQRVLGLPYSQSLKATVSLHKGEVDYPEFLLRQELFSIAKVSNENISQDKTLEVDQTIVQIRKELLVQSSEGPLSLKIFIEVPSTVDLAARKEILETDLNKKLEEKAKLEVRFNNPGFMNNASEEAKAELKANLERVQSEIEELQEALGQIAEAVK